MMILGSWEFCIALFFLFFELMIREWLSPGGSWTGSTDLLVGQDDFGALRAHYAGCQDRFHICNPGAGRFAPFRHGEHPFEGGGLPLAALWIRHRLQGRPGGVGGWTPRFKVIDPVTLALHFGTEGIPLCH